MSYKDESLNRDLERGRSCEGCGTIMLHKGECRHCAAKKAAPKRQRRIPFTADQRKKLFAGETPTIIFPGPEPPCPIPVGHIEVLSPRVYIEVTEIRRTAEGKHSLGYTLHNENLGARFMAKQHGQSHPEQYVTSPSGGIDIESGQAVDDFTQKRLTREARERETLDSAAVIIAAEDVMKALKERAEQSPEFKREGRLAMHRIRRELERLIERQRRKAA